MFKKDQQTLKSNQYNFWFLISCALIILGLFFLLFYQMEIIQWFNLKLNYKNKVISEVKIKTPEKAISEVKIKTPEKAISEVKIKTPEKAISEVKIKTIEKAISKVKIKTIEKAISKVFNDNLSRGSFTDLFSGMGWKNKKTSTVYQDFQTTAISFAPAYQWQTIEKFNQLLENKKIQIAKSNKKEVVLITEQGEIFAFNNEKQLIVGIKSEKKPQSILLNYDNLSKKWIVAFVLDKKILIHYFVVEKDEISIVDHSEISIKVLESKFKISNIQIDPIKIQLDCNQDQCLITNGIQLWKFNIKTFEVFLLSLPDIDSQLVNLSLGKAGNTWLLGVVEKNDEKKYKGNIYKFINNNWQLISKKQVPFFSSEYSGTIYFGYDSENQKTLAIYTAYEGQAFEFSLKNIDQRQNLSRIFNIRVMGNIIKPEIFYQDNAWWISSALNNSTSNFLRISSGIGIDFTPILLKNISFFQLVPGFKEHQVYGIIFNNNSSQIYRFIDLGFQKKDKVVWESLKINSGNTEVKKASLYQKNDKENKGQTQYFLSNNGGKNWIKAELGKIIDFKTRGNDFRWKVELYPSSDLFYSPWVDIVYVDYYVIRD